MDAGKWTQVYGNMLLVISCDAYRHNDTNTRPVDMDFSIRLYHLKGILSYPFASFQTMRYSDRMLDRLLCQSSIVSARCSI